MSDVDLYTTTRLRAHARCARYHHLRYDLGIQEDDGGARAFGSAGHLALEAWYGAIASGQICDALDLAIVSVQASALDPADRAKLRVLVRGYHARWADEMTSRYEVLAVEEQFRYELGGIAVGGKLDALVRERSTDRHYVVEHKFTASNVGDGEFYWERLAIDTQVSIYVDGGSMLGRQIDGVIYDVIARPTHRPLAATPDDRKKYTQGKGCRFCGGKKSAPGTGTIVAHGAERGCAVCAAHPGWEDPPRLYAGMREADEPLDDFEARLADAVAAAPDSFFRRGTVVRLDGELPTMRRDLLDRVHLIQFGAEHGVHPRNPDACWSYGEPCPFFGACSGRDDIDDPIRFPRRAAHPELAAANR